MWLCRIPYVIESGITVAVYTCFVRYSLPVPLSNAIKNHLRFSCLEYSKRIYQKSGNPQKLTYDCGLHPQGLGLSKMTSFG
jgi:hypothetical protein